MAAGTVIVRGLPELQRAFRRIDKDLSRDLRAALKAAAMPVREEATRLFSPESVASANGYRVAVRARGVAVEQSKPRTTGLRPDYGRLQMRTALLPALRDKEEEVVAGVGHVLDFLAKRNGF